MRWHGIVVSYTKKLEINDSTNVEKSAEIYITSQQIMNAD